MSSFSVVIPTVGRSEALRDTIASVLACDPPPREILVVDGSEHRSAEEIVSGFADAPIPVTHQPSPRGLTIQRNRGLAASSGEVTVFLDDDVDLEADIFTHLDRAYQDPNVLGATGRVIEPDAGRVVGKESPSKRFLFGGGVEGGFTRFGYPRRIIDPTHEQDVEFMQGCFMTVRTETGSEVGFDDTMTGYALAEDEDFSYRLSRRGRIRFMPNAIVRHKNLGFGTRDGRIFGRQVVVNRTYLFRKNFPRPLLARIQFAAFIGLLVLHRLLNREWRETRGLLEGSIEALRSRG